MKRLISMAAAAVVLAVVATADAGACTRVVYTGDTTGVAQEEVLRIVGRSLDWRTPIPTNIYVYPRGMVKVGSDQPGAVTWRSKYGAVYAVSYDGGITEGMNECGLAVNALFCKGTVYVNDRTAGRPPMSMAMFVGWILDNCSSTDEAVGVLSAQDFTITGATFDGGTVSALHWGITDAAGHTAVVEFDGGDIEVYRADSLNVLTNDPPLPQMQAIAAYWHKVGGVHMLPGTVSSADRFVRATFFDNNVVRSNDAAVGLPVLRSIMANASVPYLYTVVGEPNLSSTQWRTYANLRDRQYWFDTVTANGIYYVDLKRCDLRPGAPVLKITTADMTDVCGDATGRLVPVAPFSPMF